MQRFKPMQGDVRIDEVQVVYCVVRGVIRKSHTIVTVSEFSSEGRVWLYAGKWFVPIDVAKSGRAKMLAFIKDKMAAQDEEEAA